MPTKPYRQGDRVTLKVDLVSYTGAVMVPAGTEGEVKTLVPHVAAYFVLYDGDSTERYTEESELE